MDRLTQAVVAPDSVEAGTEDVRASADEEEAVRVECTVAEEVTGAETVHLVFSR